jgi:RimJ/RimL family protein N-acetyltransferase
MDMTLENLRKFWQKVSKFRNVFNVEIEDDFDKFLNIFTYQHGDYVGVNGLFWVIDDFVGIFYITDITPYDCLAHYIFFDRRSKGRTQITKDMLEFLFRKYGFRRISVEVPLYAKKETNAFVEGLGFKWEGRRRKAVVYDGTWFDINCYGILRERVIPPGEE